METEPAWIPAGRENIAVWGVKKKASVNVGAYAYYPVEGITKRRIDLS